MPSGEDRLLPLVCPKDPAHRFKRAELTVEVLGVSRAPMYRAPSTTTPPPSQAAPASATTPAPVEPAATIEEVGEGAAVAPSVLQQTSVHGAPGLVPSLSRSRWFLVQADPADPARGPVVVLSGHTRQQAATPASRRRRPRWTGPGAEQGRMRGRGRCCWPAPPSTSPPGWYGTARRGGASSSPGRHRDHSAGRGALDLPWWT